MIDVLQSSDGPKLLTEELIREAQEARRRSVPGGQRSHRPGSPARSAGSSRAAPARPGRLLLLRETPMTDQIHETVRRHYGEAALSVLNGESCCGDTGDYGSSLYSALEREELPDAAVMASLGCGNPIAVADLHEGERVLDLGSGGGIDVLLSARRVGPTGRAFGLDMTDEMLALAQRNAAQAGATNVEWLKGHIEAIPLPAASIDVVISNCVVNLAADKTGRLPRDRASPAARRPDRHHRHRRRRHADRRRAGRPGDLHRLHRRRALVLGVPLRARAGRADRRVADRQPSGRRPHVQCHRQGDQAARGRCSLDRRPSRPSASRLRSASGGGCCG